MTEKIFQIYATIFILFIIELINVTLGTVLTALTLYYFGKKIYRIWKYKDYSFNPIDDLF